MMGYREARNSTLEGNERGDIRACGNQNPELGMARLHGK